MLTACSMAANFAVPTDLFYAWKGFNSFDVTLSVYNLDSREAVISHKVGVIIIIILLERLLYTTEYYYLVTYTCITPVGHGYML